MRIIIVNYRYFISGGPEKYMFNIKRILEENGHEVIPFSIDSNKNIKTKYSKYFVEPIGDKNAVYFDEVKKTPKSIAQMLSRSIYSTKIKNALKKEIKEVKPDLIYTIHFINKLSPSVIDAAKECGIPIVSRLSDYFLLCPRFDFLKNQKICEECLTCGYKSCIKNKCVKNSTFASLVRVISMKIHSLIKIYDKVDMFITPSNFLKNKLIENGYDKNKIKCIPTFTTSDYNQKQKIGNYGLYFGRISEEKGVETVIKAYELLPNKELVIMGDDTTDEAIKLKEYIKTKKINNIKFIGFKSGNELEKVINDSRYVLIPSIWFDNLPNTALESFAHYKPVIASNIGSLPELVEDGVNGFLFEAGNYKELSKKIIKIDYDDLINKMGKNAHEKLKKDFSQQKHYEELLNIFNTIIKKNK